MINVFARIQKTSIGDVAVCEGEPPRGNPYLASLCGPKRENALIAFRDGSLVAQLFTFWHVPSCGGAYRIAHRNLIDWSQMRARPPGAWDVFVKERVDG